MRIIQETSDNKFTLDGIEYQKNFQAVRVGNSNQIRIIGVYDSRLSILNATKAEDVEVNGVVYNDVEVLIKELTGVLFSKFTLDGVAEDFRRSVNSRIAQNDQKVDGLEVEVDDIRQNVQNISTGVGGKMYATLQDAIDEPNKPDDGTIFQVSEVTDPSNAGVYSFQSGEQDGYKFEYKNRKGISVNTIANLRNYRGDQDEAINVLGYYSQGDGGGGEFYWDDASTEDDNGGTIIKVTGVEQGRWKRRIVDSTIETAFFGLDGTDTPENNTTILNDAMTAARDNNVDNFIISRVPGGVIEVIFPGINYQNSDSSVFFQSTIKLTDNAPVATGSIVRFTASRIKVYDIKIDGNRDNNTVGNPGTQFNFTTYQQEDVTFIGGESINSLTASYQGTSNNVTFNGVKFINSGEHCLYLAAQTDNPAKKINIINCDFVNWGLMGDRGAAVSIRDVRNTYISNTLFQPKETNPTGTSWISVHDEFNSTLGDNDRVVVTVESCRFNRNIGTGLATSNVSNKTIVTINNSFFEHFSSILATENLFLNGCVIDTSSETNQFNRIILPRNAYNCTFRVGLADVRPSTSFNLENCKFQNIDPNDGKNQYIYVDDPNIDGKIINCEFINFKNLNAAVGGIFRLANAKNMVISGNTFRDCAGTILTNNLSNLIFKDNIDTTDTVTRINMNIEPKYAVNNFFPEIPEP